MFLRPVKKRMKTKTPSSTGFRWLFLQCKDVVGSSKIFLQQFEPSYPEIIESIREAIQNKIEAEQGCVKNEAGEKEEAENGDVEKAEDESLKPDEGEDEEGEKDIKAATTEEQWKGLDQTRPDQTTREELLKTLFTLH